MSSRQSLMTLGLNVALLAAVSQAQTIPEAIDDLLDRTTPVDGGEQAIVNNSWSVLIENESGSIEYYARDAEFPRIPASNTKMFTTAAALAILGGDHVFETDVFHTGNRTGGTISGDLILRVEHDPTWNTNTLGDSRAALDLIAGTLRNTHGITSVGGQVEVWGATAYSLGSTSLSHWQWFASTGGGRTVQDDRNRDAASAFRSALLSAGIAVPNSTVDGVHEFATPPGATLIYTHTSALLNYQATGAPLRLEVVIRPLNKFSHNAMADLLLRHLAWTQDTQNPPRDFYSVGSGIVIDWLEDVPGIDTTGIAMNDGSGIDNTNRFSARQTVDLTRYMVRGFPFWDESLPISGSGGTLGSRLTDFAGDVHAKTGTLPTSGSVSLSGYFDNPEDNQRYYFSFYANNTAGSSVIDVGGSRGAFDDMIRVLGSRRPARAPGLQRLVNLGGGDVRVTLAQPDFTTNAYHVATSPDGTVYTDVPVDTTSYIIESATGGLNNGDYSDTAGFESSSSHSTAPGLTPGIGSRFLRPTSGPGTATFAPSGLASGRYQVDVTCFDFSSADAPNTEIRITDATGTRSAFFDLSRDTAGDRWRTVGTIDFTPGDDHRVEFRNNAQRTTGFDDRMNPAAVRFSPMEVTLVGLPPRQTRWVRATATGPRQLESESSDVYTVAASSGTAELLLIDAFDRWDDLSDNPDNDRHDFVARWGAAIGGYSYDVGNNEDVIQGAVTLGDYRAALWLFGEESTVDETFGSAEQSLARAHHEAGGAMLVSGAEVGWDLDRNPGESSSNPSSSDRAFFADVLHAAYLNDGTASTTQATGTGAPFGPIGTFPFFTPGTSPYQAGFPDGLAAVGPGASTVMTYANGTQSGAAVAYDGSAGGGRVVYLGFPFELIEPAGTRSAVMGAALGFLLPASATDLWMLIGD